MGSCHPHLSMFHLRMNKFTLLFVVVLSQALYTLPNPDTSKVLASKADNLVLSVHNVTKDSYSSFLSSLRDIAYDEVHSTGRIPVLPDPSSLDENHRFFEVDLIAYEESVTLGIDRTNLYVVGYQVGGQAYFFRDAPQNASSHLFREAHKSTLPFGSGYPQLGNRSNIEVGFNRLSEAIGFINEAPNRTYDHRKHLVVIIQMVSEAARYGYIEWLFRSSLRRGVQHSFTPNEAMLRLENSWGGLSTRIQEAIDGAFLSPMNLIDRDGIERTITTVQQVIGQIALMIFICRRQEPNNVNPHNYLKMVSLKDDICASDEVTVNIVGAGGLYNVNAHNYLKMVSLKDDICPSDEVTVNIVGAGGLCVDVKGGCDNDGNPIILWPCHSRENQKWTLKKDGTIQSLGKCMTAYSYTPGVYVMLFNCATAMRDATLWSIWPNGTIVLANKPVALSGKGGVQNTTLTVENNLYAAYQGWLPTTDVEPFVISIIGYNDFCLQGGTSEFTHVSLDECSKDNLNQRWAVFGDGSIRKNNDRNLCLTSDGHSSGDLIILRTCRGWADQRWVFQADGSILNPGSGLVMDVTQSDPSLHQIIIYPATGNPNQKWYQIF